MRIPSFLLNHESVVILVGHGAFTVRVGPRKKKNITKLRYSVSTFSAIIYSTPHGDRKGQCWSHVFYRWSTLEASTDAIPMVRLRR